MNLGGRPPFYSFLGRKLSQNAIKLPHYHEFDEIVLVVQQRS